MAIRNLRLELAGARERYAMKHYSYIEKKIVDGRELYVYHYSKSDKYQDANGATWDNTNSKWVG